MQACMRILLLSIYFIFGNKKEQRKGKLILDLFLIFINLDFLNCRTKAMTFYYLVRTLQKAFTNTYLMPLIALAINPHDVRRTVLT